MKMSLKQKCKKFKCHGYGNFTEMEMSKNGNNTEVKMSLRLKCQ